MEGRSLRSSRIFTAAVIAVGTAWVAGASAGAAKEASGQPATARSTRLAPLPPLARRCSVPGVRATTFRFRATDGVLLDGAVLGGGDVGVVLAHEALGDLCRWVPFADVLSQEGFRVLVFDYRGFGLSAKVSGKREARFDADVLGAMTELRRRGAKKIVLGGASLGGAVVVTAAASARPAPAGVVSISAPNTAFLRGGGYPAAVLNPTAAAARVRSPMLFLASKDDPFVPSRFTRALYRAATVKDKRLVVLTGTSHGISLVGDEGGSKEHDLILEFIRARTDG